ncbi:cytochrome c3 family protein [Aestuariivivens sediminis]|uniref:cytochrome c3 family protein n=1 Tax=Aestuariivivens sediminis TaxID=2913557 RepID=UPI001F565617|nr:cytochrome c3 family protein [Aestuariivivens sediminis]
MFNNKHTYLVLLLLNVLACSPTSTYNIKSFFFDGVPQPQLKITNEEVTELGGPVADSTILFKVSDNIHPPYKERACAECHSKAYMGVPKMKQPQLCYQCHEDFRQQIGFLHGPVASGNCTQCHHPHQSKIEKLLIRNGQDLCLKCHIKDKIVNNRVHTHIESKNCMACHNPHGGSDINYLNKNSCFSCHDDFTAQNVHIHGPVASRECSMCHESHKSSAPKLLRDPGNQLCLNCHGMQDIFATAYHSPYETSACTECHDPHSSDRKYFLTLNTP